MVFPADLVYATKDLMLNLPQFTRRHSRPGPRGNLRLKPYYQDYQVGSRVLANGEIVPQIMGYWDLRAFKAILDGSRPATRQAVV
jgi:hypothetical protein